MKKLIFLVSLIVVLISYTNLSAQSDRIMESSVPPDSVILKIYGGEKKHFYKYNSNGQIIEDKIITSFGDEIFSIVRMVFEYDENGNKILELTEGIIDSSVWVNSRIMEYEYDDNNNLTSEIIRNWENNAWVDYSRTLYEYNEDNNVTLKLFQFGGEENNVWEDYYRETYEYNSDGKQVLSVLDYWEETYWDFFEKFIWEYDNNGFIASFAEIRYRGNVYKDTYVNDSDGKVLEHIEYDGNDTAWVKDKKYVNEYNDKEMLETTIDSTWQENQWVLTGRKNYSYNTKGEETILLTESWQDSSWTNVTLDSSIYNSSGRIEEFISSRWKDNVWTRDYGFYYEYDNEGNSTYLQARLWRDGILITEGISGEFIIKVSDELQFTYRGAYLYAYYSNSVTTVNEIDQLPAKFSLGQNYPNPFNPTTTIKYSIPVVAPSPVEGQHVQLKIYDILGNEVTTLVNANQSPGAYEVDFNAAAFSSGVYFYTIRAGKFTQTKKMILLR